jgi:hypothetical protein
MKETYRLAARLGRRRCRRLRRGRRQLGTRWQILDDPGELHDLVVLVLVTIEIERLSAAFLLLAAEVGDALDLVFSLVANK